MLRFDHGILFLLLLQFQIKCLLRRCCLLPPPELYIDMGATGAREPFYLGRTQKAEKDLPSWTEAWWTSRRSSPLEGSLPLGLAGPKLLPKRSCALFKR